MLLASEVRTERSQTYKGASERVASSFNGER